MTIAHCPVCREQVTVPAGVDGEAVVQCPLCQEEFPLGDVLSQLPPALIVIRSAPAAALGADAGSQEPSPPLPPITVLYDESADEPETAESEEVHAPAFHFEAAPALPRSSRAARTVRRRSSPGPLRHIIQIVLGGVVGIALAQVILWWIPANLSINNRDLTGLGRKYGNYVPFLVPASIREQGENGESVRLARSEPTSESASQEPAARRAARRPSELPELSFAETQPSAGDGLRTEAPRSSGTPDLSSTDGAADAGLVPRPPALPPARPQDELEDVAISPTRESPAAVSDQGAVPGKKDVEQRPSDAGVSLPIDVPEVEAVSPAAAVPQFSTDSLPPSSAAASLPSTVSPQSPSGELKRRFAEALAASDALDAYAGRNVDETRRLAANFYRNLSELGDAVASADPADAQTIGTAEDAAALLRRIAARAERVELIARVTPSWLDNKRPNEGVCLVGKVKSLATRGGAYEAQVELADGRRLAVLSRRNPTAALAADSRVLVLGALIDSPAQRIAGYTGDASRAVIEAAYVAVPLE